MLLIPVVVGSLAGIVPLNAPADSTRITVLYDAFADAAVEQTVRI
jgi:hypothetical protein